MYVKCINIKKYSQSEYPASISVEVMENITLGKIYKVDSMNFEYYNIQDNSGRYENYYKSRFILLDKIRNDKLIELGI